MALTVRDLKLLIEDLPPDQVLIVKSTLTEAQAFDLQAAMSIVDDPEIPAALLIDSIRYELLATLRYRLSWGMLSIRRPGQKRPTASNEED